MPLLTGRAAAHRDQILGLYGTEGAPFTAAEIAAADLDGPDGHPRGIRWFSPLVARGQFAMLRTLRWKLVYYQGGEGELYDLAADPGELENRYADPAFADVRAELTRALLDRLLAALPTGPARLGPAPSH